MFFKKSGGGGVSYEGRTGMSGHFFVNVDTQGGWAGKFGAVVDHHSKIVVQYEGRPNCRRVTAKHEKE